MDMVKILLNFIKVERMGNWSLHLEAVLDILPYLAASGHSLYVKSARIYMQTMLSWERTIQMCTVTSLRVSMSPEEVVGEQNKEMGKPRQHRDKKDTYTLQLALVDRHPFKIHAASSNIMTGVNAGSKIDVDDAKIIGDKIMHCMTNQSVVHYKFKRKDQATTLLKARSSV